MGNRAHYYPEEDPYRAHRCDCLHLDCQHGTVFPGCWHCPCPAFTLLVVTP